MSPLSMRHLQTAQLSYSRPESPPSTPITHLRLPSLSWQRPSPCSAHQCTSTTQPWPQAYSVPGPKPSNSRRSGPCSDCLPRSPRPTPSLQAHVRPDTITRMVSTQLRNQECPSPLCPMALSHLIPWSPSSLDSGAGRWGMTRARKGQETATTSMPKGHRPH